MRLALAAVILATLLSCRAQASSSPRVLSVDQCADNYLLALAPREAIVGVSPRAADPDSYMRATAFGLPRRRPTLESILLARPQLVVRYWTVSGGLAPALRRRGVHVIQLEDAVDFDGVRRNIRTLAAAIGQRARGEAMIATMDASLARSRDAWRGRRALYLTPAGFTAGAGTFTAAMLSAAGLVDAESGHGYRPVSLEALTLRPPDLYVLGFFDGDARARWEPGRRPLIDRLVRGRTVAALPARLLTCPAWFAAEGVQRLAQSGRRRS